MPKHMGWVVLGDLLVVAHDEHSPNDDEWHAFVREYRAHAPKLRALLVYSLGGGPISAQRKQLLEMLTSLPHVPTAFMVTSSALMRGVVTAMSWFLPAAKRARTFRLDEVDQVFAILGLDAATRTATRRALDTMFAVLRGSEGSSSSAEA
jgi:hypothetical protein